MLKNRHFLPLSQDLRKASGKSYPEKHIFLTGFMGAGKTTVGRHLAKILNRPFLDMDEELVKYHKKSISQIFAENGENFFRRTETTLLNSLSEQDRPKVIAAGGGSVLAQANIHIFKQALTFFLELSPEKAWERINRNQDEARPLAVNYAAFKDLLLSRLDRYRQCGAAFPADGAPEEIAAKIADFILYEEPLELKAEGRACQIRPYVSPEDLRELKETVVGGRKCFVLADHFFQDASDDFTEVFRDAVFASPEKRGEEAKTLEEAATLLLKMTEAKLDRSDFLIVRGGGSLTDLGALCAGLYKRGLNLILVPTTLLAAVDAAIGGKAAVNLAGAKNQVGLFHLAKEVWIDPLSFKTLPPALLRDGLTEAYKTALLFDPGLVDLITRNLDSLLNGDVPLLAQTASDSARHKASLVAKDLREEKGLRDLLNLGHTYGHAAESYNAPEVSHGQAVALGLAVALNYSRRLHNLDPHLAQTGIDICRRLAGGRFPPPPPKDEALRLLGFDKKIRQGELNFVALKAPGQAFLDKGVKAEAILEAAEELSIA
ncbi:MAG: AAA family ATPase [Deltaproteobacteria bacterium]|nr:AAA family ATPase [Deltaproteobacteria bacterium]